MRIECNKDITINQGDKGFINFRCANRILKAGDRVEFDICELGTKIVVDEFTEEGIAPIDIESRQTSCNKGTYTYTIRVITSDGYNETVLIGKFVII